MQCPAHNHKEWRKNLPSDPEFVYFMYKKFMEYNKVQEAVFPWGLTPIRFRSDIVSVNWGNQRFDNIRVDQMFKLFARAFVTAMEETWEKRKLKNGAASGKSQQA